MKPLFILLFVLLSLLASGQYLHVPQLYTLKGNVKRMEMRKRLEGTKKFDYITCNYNNAGRLTRGSVRSAGFRSRYRFYYDDNNRVSQVQIRSRHGLFSPLERKTVFYKWLSANECRLYQVRGKDTVERNTRIFERDSLGRIVDIRPAPKPWPHIWAHFEYDLQNRIYIEHFDEGIFGKSFIVLSFGAFDNNGNPLTASGYDVFNPQYSWERVYEYVYYK